MFSNRSFTVPTKHNNLYKTKDDLDLFPCTLNCNDDLPLDLSKTSIKNEIIDKKPENEHFKCHLNKQKSISNGHLSPTAYQQSSNGINGQRRFRTQMTLLQIKLMKAILLEYRTPTL